MDISSGRSPVPIISTFGSVGNGERNDGINIAAKMGEPIHAAAGGTVTYAGNELKGYGNLILIRHDDGYVTAYAHAQSIGVRRGDHVDKGPGHRSGGSHRRRRTALSFTLKFAAVSNLSTPSRF
jgi:murein DD-endopeptidase MepM/ murein hydrolase activator NlpD